jgi:response regulator of citrate/malate metabolism
MVYFIKGKMEAYRRNCGLDELKYFRVLEMKYITPKKYSTQDIAEEENIGGRTAHRYLNKAIEDLPVIFFGVDAIKFEK